MRIGLGVVLHVKYKDCKEENKIKPYCSHRMGRRGPKTVTLNSRAALAMICTGSHSHLKADSSILGVGEMTGATFKAREREVGAAIESVCQESCPHYITLHQSMWLSGAKLKYLKFLRVLAALAMICTGSHSHLKADSSILGVGEMTGATFKAREREVGAAIESVCQESCPHCITLHQLMWLSGAKLKYLKFLRVLFGKVLATSNEQPGVLMASLFGFGRNMLRF